MNNNMIVVVAKQPRVIGASVLFLPNDIGDEIFAPKNFVHQDFKIMPFVVVDDGPDAAVLGEQTAQKIELRSNHRQPLRVFEVVVVVFEILSRVVRRIDENALDRPGVMRHKRFQGEQIVALDEDIFVVCFAVRKRVIGDEGAIRRRPGGANIRRPRLPRKSRHYEILPKIANRKTNFPQSKKKAGRDFRAPLSFQIEAS